MRGTWTAASMPGYGMELDKKTIGVRHSKVLVYLLNSTMHFLNAEAKQCFLQDGRLST